MTNGSVMSQPNQMRQFYNGQRTNGHSQQQIHPQLQQQIITVPTVQQSYGGQSMAVNGTNTRVTNTQQRNALRNMPITTPSEIIDLSSPPSSPGPSQTSQEIIRTSAGWELQRIPERPWVHDAQSNAAYKVNE